MALSLDPVYFNRTAGTNVDKAGKFLIELKNALHANWLASGSLSGWRRTCQADGISALSTTIDADIFTGNGGLGYKTGGTAWATPQANTISNPRAYIQWTLYLAGVSTGRQIQIQRSVNGGTDEAAAVTWGLSPTPFTGTPTATNAPATSASAIAPWADGIDPPTFNAGVGNFNFSNSLASTANIPSTTTFGWQIWVDDGTGEGGFLGDFLFNFYISATQDRGSGGGYLSLLDTATADTTPFISGAGSWQAAFGGDPTYTDGGNFVSGSTTVWKGHRSGAVHKSCTGLFVGGDGSVFPPAVATQPATDMDSKYEFMPWISYTVSATNVSTRRGIVRGARIAHTGLAAQRYPHVATDSDGGVWILLGCVAVPWRSGVVPNWATSSSSSTWVVRFPEAVPVIPDVPDETPPTVDLVSPPEDGVDVLLESEQTVTVDIGDETAIGYYAIYAIYETLNMYELVLESEDLDLPTNYTVTDSVVSGKLRYEIVRTGGWPAPVRIRTRVIDRSGNVV